MAAHFVLDGETWQSIADALGVPVSWLLLANGCDPQNPPPDPEAESQVVAPGPPPAHSVAPENDASIELGPGGVHTLQMLLHDDDGEEMTNVRYRLAFFGRTVRTTSPDGWVTLAYPSGTCARIDLAWGDASDGSDEYLYRASLSTDNYAGEGADYIAVSTGAGEGLKMDAGAGEGSDSG